MWLVQTIGKLKFILLNFIPAKKFPINQSSYCITISTFQQSVSSGLMQNLKPSRESRTFPFSGSLHDSESWNNCTNLKISMQRGISSIRCSYRIILKSIPTGMNYLISNV